MRVCFVRLGSPNVAKVSLREIGFTGIKWDSKRSIDIDHKVKRIILIPS